MYDSVYPVLIDICLHILRNERSIHKKPEIKITLPVSQELRT